MSRLREVNLERKKGCKCEEEEDGKHGTPTDESALAPLDANPLKAVF